MIVLLSLRQSKARTGAQRRDYYYYFLLLLLLFFPDRSLIVFGTAQTFASQEEQAAFCQTWTDACQSFFSLWLIGWVRGRWLELAPYAYIPLLFAHACSLARSPIRMLAKKDKKFSEDASEYEKGGGEGGALGVAI